MIGKRRLLKKKIDEIQYYTIYLYEKILVAPGRAIQIKSFSLNVGYIKSLKMVMRQNCLEALRSVPLFGCSTVIDDAFISDLVTHLKYEFFQPSDLIIKKGSIGYKMYFLQSGRVHILTDKGPLWLRDGAYFGGMRLFLADYYNSFIIDSLCNIARHTIIVYQHI